MTKSVHSARYAELRRLLVEARQAAAMTQVDAAKRLRKPQSYLSKVESGERRIDIVEFLDLAEAVGADPVAIVKKLHRMRR